MNSSRSDQFLQVRTPRPSQVSSVLFDYVSPPTSEGPNSFVRTPFRVFLDSMESPLSQDSINVPVMGNERAHLGQLSSERAGHLGYVRSARLGLTTYDLKFRKVITPSSEFRFRCSLTIWKAH